MASRIGQTVAKVLGIHPEKHRPPPDPVADGDTYYEKEPTTKEFLLEHRPTVGGLQRYLRSLFPFWSWIFHYNLVWLIGDLIAGGKTSSVIASWSRASKVSFHADACPR
jgi:sodium-independent sulfate anion transporter 11